MRSPGAVITGNSYRAISSEYLPELERAKAERAESLQKVKDESMSRFKKDLASDRERNPNSLEERWETEEGEEGDDDDAEIIDRSGALTYQRAFDLC